MIGHKFLFWQPTFDLLSYLKRFVYGSVAIIILNYFIWLFFVFISFLLVIHDPNTFWQLLVATMFAELIEKYGKSHVLWKRPFFSHHRHVPTGLVESWYETGSFPSGHTIKATYFFLFVIQYSVISPTIFLSVVLPLLAFRVYVGFHYPIDMLGGCLIGVILWFISSSISASPFLNNFIKIILTYVFG